MRGRLVWAAAAGWLAGGLAASLPLWAEAAERFAVAHAGGSGERALWGGPATFAVLRVVLPSEWTLAGALAGAVLVLLWPSRRSRGRARR